MPTTTIYEERFQRVLDGYEADGPDCTVPGASKGPARYCVVTESTRGHGYFANYAETLADVETVAAANLDESWQPVCYFDLDVLAGDEPKLTAGDEILNEDGQWVEVTDIQQVSEDRWRVCWGDDDFDDRYVYLDELDGQS
ncbi:MAG: hypothetical protein AB7O61_24825, partial [Acidimicrobiia bacterium]